MPSEGLPKAHSRRLLRRERRGEGEEVLIVSLLLIAVLLLCATAQLLSAARIMVAAMMSCWIFCSNSYFGISSIFKCFATARKNIH